MDRLDLAHAMIVKTIGNRLYLAPLQKERIHKMLDIGTGTGICTQRSILIATPERRLTTPRGGGNG